MPVTPKQKRRGMSMGTRALMFSSLLLIALPWIGYRYFEEMKQFLLQGQEDAQLLTAKAVATVLHGREELFYPEDAQVDVDRVKSALYVYPLENPIAVDGYTDDWGALLQQARGFGVEHMTFSRIGGSSRPATFSLLLGEYGRYVNALIHVRDKTIVYRNPKYRRLDHSDHVRVELVNADGSIRRLMLITEGEGQVSVYEMKPGWKLPGTGKPFNALSGFWREHLDGYYLELQMPASWLKASPYMKISVANVDSAEEAQVDSVTATTDNSAASPNSLVSRSPELDRLLRGLGHSEASICVIDRFRRIRAVFDGDNLTTMCALTDRVAGELVDGALGGSPAVARFSSSSGDALIVAAHPVYANEDIMGAVLVEKSSRHILGLQHKSLVRIIVATLVVFLAAILGLMLFSAWLSYRIRKLQKEASQAIDADGRVVADHLNADQYAVDEIGQLSRDFSLLLSRLKSYTGFLESVPRTLRHEILNPINTISMSLQNIAVDQSEGQTLQSALRATQQLEMIVHSLTEAAHIDEALMQDDNQRFDLAALVREYVENSRLKHGNSRFRYTGPDSGIFIFGNDLRIAQLLDKLKDNALEFSDADSEIRFDLAQRDFKAEFSITNHGPVISDEVMDSLFTGITSKRPGQSEKPHLGIGLFIANRIAQQHQGELKIMNLYKLDGVKVVLTLPVAE